MAPIPARSVTRKTWGVMFISRQVGIGFASGPGREFRAASLDASRLPFTKSPCTRRAFDQTFQPPFGQNVLKHNINL
jgi:hypothetical protein